MKKKHNKKPKEICDVCGCDVFINLGIYDITGMCGVCSTGESVLAYEDQHPRV